MTKVPASTLAVIAAGGAIGACARYGATLLWPTGATAFPWTTFAINITGSALLGVVLVLIIERATVHPLVRPFVGTGIIGGYTTFSTYAVDAQRLIGNGHALTALVYLTATLLTALAAVWAAAALTRAALGRKDHA
ncbi:CrcB protein [Amycolatopsis xylanica]|uniref:Fluoride-specific ion channel FluC n=1 Tax=Amycolatopsis xylanica TaxID=589385 RepID=A0A1H2TJH2_9PSEU|nr:CrcB family protein [Amycolatopsis xylanica]SDW43845.1 CrcB protein [Amycolatopsis xylanica]